MSSLTRFQIIAGALLLMGTSGIGLAQSSGAENTGSAFKVGFVSTFEVLQGTGEGKRKLAKLEEYASGQQREFESQASGLEKLRQQLQTQQRTLNVETRLEMQRSIEEKDRKLKRFQEDAQLELNRRRDKLLTRLGEKIQRVVSEYAQQNNFSALFLRDPSFQVYVAPSFDLTSEIIRVYNQRNPVAASSISSQSPTAK